MIYILYICMFVPLLLSLPLIHKTSRRIMVFLLIGISAALFISEINGLMLRLLGYNTPYVTTTVTPVTEEIIKAIPVLIYAFVVSDDPKKLVASSLRPHLRSASASHCLKTRIFLLPALTPYRSNGRSSEAFRPR